MPLIEWDDSFSVKVEQIDGQHKRLVGYINDLHEGMLGGRSKDILSAILDGLVNYTVEHFKTEEDYMKEFGFEGYEAHKHEHEKFVAKVSEFQKGYKEGNAALSMDLMNFLRDWLINHIKGTDQKYVQCFNEHGLH